MVQRTRKELFGNTALVLLSCFVTYCAAEFLLFPYFVRHLPLRFHIFLNEPGRLIAQSSKAAPTPKEGYIAILGDSFAQGLGNWLITSDPGSNGPFHSAHVIADKVGIDVVSLGKGGTGSPENLIWRATDLFDVLQNGWRLRFPKPGRMFVYFYEGNDLSDNLHYLTAHVDPVHGPGCWRDPNCLDARLIADHGQTSGTVRRTFRQLYFGRMVVGMAVDLWERRTRTSAIPFSFDGKTPVAPPPGTITKVRVAGQVLGLPDDMAGPSMELSAAETERAVVVFERSLANLVSRYPDVPITVVYVPSPLSTYQLMSAEVSTFHTRGRSNRFPSTAVATRSNEIAMQIATATKRCGLTFIDARPTIRAHAKLRMVHGPLDPGHFNENGYRALAEAIVNSL